MPSYLCFPPHHGASSIVFTFCHSELPLHIIQHCTAPLKCLNKLPTKYERWGKQKRRHNEQRLMYNVFLQFRKQVCLSLWVRPLVSSPALSFCDYRPQTATVLMFRSSIKSQSRQFCTVKACIPQGCLCVFAAVLVLFICLSQVLSCGPRRYRH